MPSKQADMMRILDEEPRGLSDLVEHLQRGLQMEERDPPSQKKCQPQIRNLKKEEEEEEEVICSLNSIGGSVNLAPGLRPSEDSEDENGGDPDQNDEEEEEEEECIQSLSSNGQIQGRGCSRPKSPETRKNGEDPGERINKLRLSLGLGCQAKS